MGKRRSPANLYHRMVVKAAGIIDSAASASNRTVKLVINDII